MVTSTVEYRVYECAEDTQHTASLQRLSGILAGPRVDRDCGLVCGLFKWQKAGGFPPACCTVQNKIT